MWSGQVVGGLHSKAGGGQHQEHRSGLECRTVNRLLPCVGSFTDG